MRVAADAHEGRWSCHEQGVEEDWINHACIHSHGYTFIEYKSYADPICAVTRAARTRRGERVSRESAARRSTASESHARARRCMQSGWSAWRASLAGRCGVRRSWASTVEVQRWIRRTLRRRTAAFNPPPPPPQTQRRRCQCRGCV
jgi:hypothetical protein